MAQRRRERAVELDGERQDALLAALRREASDVKDCFTRFSFQGMALSAAVIATIGALHSQPATGTQIWACLMVAILNTAVMNIGLHKYGGANRALAYELYLERTQRCPDYPEGWKRSMRDLGWEEAICAWRIVQSTVFERIYVHGFLKPNFLRKVHHAAGSRRWYDIPTQMSEGASYHPGDYLRTLMHLLGVIIVLSLSSAAWMWSELPDGNNKCVWAVVGAGTYVLVAWRGLQILVRRRVLQNGLLSIQSSAIMWQAVVVAHYRAVEKLVAGGRDPREYATRLSHQARSLAENLYEIHDWVRGAPRTCPECGGDLLTHRPCSV
jgi:hypothetical protein